jgi:hypothetical protein
MYVDSMQYPHFVAIVVASLSVILHYVRCFNAIPSSIVPNLARQKVIPLIQNENGDVIEDNEWVHKGSRWFCKVDACTCFYAAKWLCCQHLEQTHSLRMQAKKSRCPSTHLGMPRQQKHIFMNVCILNNPHTRQKQNEKKALDQVKKKTKF